MTDCFCISVGCDLHTGFTQQERPSKGAWSGFLAYVFVHGTSRHHVFLKGESLLHRTSDSQVWSDKVGKKAGDPGTPRMLSL